MLIKRKAAIEELKELFGDEFYDYDLAVSYTHLGKTESYYLVRKNYFKVITVGTTMRVMIPSFEEWYANQSFYKKVRCV